MIQELMANSLGLKLGTYRHMVGSLHMYVTQKPAARKYLDEGWQSTKPMPPMPRGDPEPSLRSLLDIEERLRSGGSATREIATLPNYWKDLAHLLEFFTLARPVGKQKTDEFKQQMSTDAYHGCIKRRSAPRTRR
jgi:thymidylate synthase